MALAGEKVGIPSADEAPMIVMARYKQPFAGVVSILIVFIISIITWWIFFDSRWHSHEVVPYASVIGGFGLIGVVWAIWFENWPYYNWFRTPWKVGLVGTLFNATIILIFTLVLLPLFNSYYSAEITDDYVAWYVGASIFGALSGSCFSFAILWVAGTMYWPFFKFKQPKRGIIVWVIGNAITVLVWFFLFFPNGNREPSASIPTAVKGIYAPIPNYPFSLGWTQWIIFFSLLTMMVFEYWPWNKLGRKQPFMGMIASAVCVLLGLFFAFLLEDIGRYIFDPIFRLIGGTIPSDPFIRLTGWYYMSISYAIFLICAVVLVSLFFDNWPKKYSQWKNFLIRFILVIALGTIGFFGFYLISPIFFGEPHNFWEVNPTPFVLWFLWIEILFAYVWRKWPIYKAV
ncbi:MAG: hypothetical protein ACFE94_04200 [Candidatus Hodarchaeota archaeon]